MTAATPRTVGDYLDLLRAELQGADRALVQDALYDAEEHLRAELAQHPDVTEETMLDRIVASYGAPAEVADAYRSNEMRVQAALRTPPPKPKHTALGRFFGVYRRSACVPQRRLHAARAGDGHFLFHVRRHRPVAVGRVCHPDHRHPVLPAVHRHDARAGAGGRSHRRNAARHTHAAQARAPGPATGLDGSRARHAARPAHVGHAALPAADAAARTFLLHVRDRRHRLLADADAGPDRRVARITAASSPSTALSSRRTRRCCL